MTPVNKLNAMKYIHLYCFSLIAGILSNSIIICGQDANTLKLNDFRPISMYKTPQTKIDKAK